jgi:hypothetical protein
LTRALDASVDPFNNLVLRATFGREVNF